MVNLKSLFQNKKKGLSKPKELQKEALPIVVENNLESKNTDDIWAESDRRGREIQEKLIQLEGGTWKTDQVMEFLGVDRAQKLDELREQGRILGVWWNDEYIYPAWQFGESGKILPGLQSVITKLETYSSWEKLAFMLSQNIRLKNKSTPLKELRQGNIEAVVLAATA
jgi:hypothetical protein